MDDEDCDSTWEEEEEEQEKEKEERKTREEAKPRQQQRGNQAFQNRMIGCRNWRAVQDMQRYRRQYPGLTDEESNDEMMNLKFYKNEIAFLPNGHFIEDILKKWRKDYDRLEDNHSYIQWLFPLRERGVNWHAKPLTLREIQEFKKSAEVMKRFVQAYELMLDFYGIELEDRETGKVRKTDNYQERFKNLDLHSHNNLRITRILKCLGEMGYEHYQVPLIHFFLEETLVHQDLPSVKQSALDYFMFTVRNKKERRKLVYYAWKNFSPQYKFVWGPQEKLQKFERGIPPSSLRQDCLEEEGSTGSQNEVGIEKDQVRTQVREEIVREDTVSEVNQMDKKDPSAMLQMCEMKQGERSNSSDEQEEKVATKSAGDQEPRPQSPKESKKRKYEVKRLESSQEEEQSQGTSDVEKIALNLEECALNQSNMGTSSGSEEMGNLDLSKEKGPSSPESMDTKMSDEIKRRKLENKAQENNIETTENGEQTTTCLPIPNGISHKAKEKEDKSSIGWETKSLQVGIVKQDDIAITSSGNSSGDPASVSMSPDQSEVQEYVHIEKGNIDINPELKRPCPLESTGAECSDKEVPQKAEDETTVERPHSE